MNTISNRNSAHPMRNCSTHPIEQVFFSFGEGREGCFDPFVPNVFPNMFSRAPHFVPYALPNVLEPILVGENWDLDV